MSIDAFTLHAPSTLDEALALLREHGDAATVHAGGTTLVLLMKWGLCPYPHVVHLGALRDESLRAIRWDEDRRALRIGALATHRQLEVDPLVGRRFPLVQEIERQLGNVRVRHQGTVGGNVVYGFGDLALMATVCDGAYGLRHAGGLREQPAAGFVSDGSGERLAEDGLLVELVLPVPRAGEGAAYEKFLYRRKESISVAATVRLEGDAVQDARVAVAIVEPVPRRLGAAEQAVVQLGATAEGFAAAAEAAAGAVDPVSDIYGPADYKRHLTRVLVRRTLQRASARAADGAPA
jgi:carbon-monoxide dehydrogenase medium subunit